MRVVWTEDDWRLLAPAILREAEQRNVAPTGLGFLRALIAAQQILPRDRQRSEKSLTSGRIHLEHRFIDECALQSLPATAATRTADSGKHEPAEERCDSASQDLARRLAPIFKQAATVIAEWLHREAAAHPPAPTVHSRPPSPPLPGKTEPVMPALLEDPEPPENSEPADARPAAKVFRVPADEPPVRAQAAGLPLRVDIIGLGRKQRQDLLRSIPLDSQSVMLRFVETDHLPRQWANHIVVTRSLQSGAVHDNALKSGAIIHRVGSRAEEVRLLLSALLESQGN
jgi:hypothetical protein